MKITWSNLPNAGRVTDDGTNYRFQWQHGSDGSFRWHCRKDPARDIVGKFSTKQGAENAFRKAYSQSKVKFRDDSSSTLRSLRKAYPNTDWDALKVEGNITLPLPDGPSITVSCQDARNRVTAKDYRNLEKNNIGVRWDNWGFYTPDSYL